MVNNFGCYSNNGLFFAVSPQFIRFFSNWVLSGCLNVVCFLLLGRTRTDYGVDG